MAVEDAVVGEGRRLQFLAGVKVLDLTGHLAGPYGSQVLGDLGASVTKVERMTGDSTRQNPPYFFEGDSAYFLSANRNKRSLAVNLRAPATREVLGRLVEQSDIILDNLRAPQREALGLNFEQIRQRNPRIISCSVTGFGSDGPYSDRPAYAIIVEALAGVMSLTGPEGGPSVRAGVPIGDITAGLYTVIGALAGLQYRQTTGRGIHIDVGMLDSQVSLLSYLAQYFFTGGLVASHQGRAHVSVPTYNTFESSDGQDVVVAANTQEMWERLAQVLGRAELIDDPRFVDRKTRLVHRDELLDILKAEFRARSAQELVTALHAAEVPVAPINRINEALDDPQVRHREMVVSVRHRTGKEFLSVGRPIKSPQAEGEPFRSPPGLGEHTAEVLAEVGYSDAEIEDLVAQGAVNVG